MKDAGSAVDADALARAAGEAMWRADRATKWLGMQLGDRLISECREAARVGRTGLYDARVTNQKGELIALFRGKSAAVKGSWVERPA